MMPPVCRPHAERYAADQDNFFLEYAAAHKKLSENVRISCFSFRCAFTVPRASCAITTLW